MAPYKRGGIWWYKFYFAGQLICESSKSTSKTVAKGAEQQRRRELETGFHNLKEVRQQRIRGLRDIIAEYLVGCRLRYRSATLAEYAFGFRNREGRGAPASHRLFTQAAKGSPMQEQA